VRFKKQTRPNKLAKHRLRGKSVGGSRFDGRLRKSIKATLDAQTEKVLHHFNGFDTMPREMIRARRVEKGGGVVNHQVKPEKSDFAENRFDFKSGKRRSYRGQSGPRISSARLANRFQNADE